MNPTQILKKIPGLRLLYNRLMLAVGGASQSDEAALIATLVEAFKLPRRFVEFGFHPRQFNCIEILSRSEGLLIDGDVSTVSMSKRLLPNNIEVQHRFITLENIEFITDFFGERPVGVISIDVDGNDFWFAEALIGLGAGLLVLEYNASFGHEAITVPYDPAFERKASHESGWYHGASLEAMTRLTQQHGYRLVATSQAGGNAFYLRQDLQDARWPTLSAVQAYRESRLRNLWAKSTAAEQWSAIESMPFIKVDAQGKPSHAAVNSASVKI